MHEEYLDQLFERPWYAHCVFHSAHLAWSLGYDAVSVVEFGVAGGNGLVLLEKYANEISQVLGIEIQVYGFDRGKGLPAPTDYRDTPYCWGEGFYEMDEPKLRSRLTNARLVLGDVSETVRTFADDYQPAPIAAVFFDLDMYSSTKAAFGIFDLEEKFRIPRVYCFFDDIFGNPNTLTSDFTGERLAITEFNSENATRKISSIYYPSSSTLLRAENIFIHHDFGHSKYNQRSTDRAFPTQLPLSE